MPVRDANAYNRNRAKERASKGLCKRCSNMTINGKTLCPNCREKDSQRYKAIAKARKESGMCPKCGNHPKSSDSVLCPECKIKGEERSKRHVLRRKESGTCRRCSQPAVKDRAFCVDCLGSMVERARIDRKRNRAKGLCKCGNQPAPGFKLCQKCRENGQRNGTKAYRRKAYGGNWEKARERDKDTCQICGTQERRLTVHHIDGHGESNSDTPNNSLDNLITLCQRCHNAFTTLCIPQNNLKKAIELLEIYIAAN